MYGSQSSHNLKGADAMLKLILLGLFSVSWNGLFLLIYRPASFLVAWGCYSLFCGLVFGCTAARYRTKCDTAQLLRRDLPTLPRTVWLWLISPMLPALNYYWYYNDGQSAYVLGLIAMLVMAIAMIATFKVLRPFFRWFDQEWTTAPIAGFGH
jgi:hypothetical protein